MFEFVCLWFIVKLDNFSFIWKRHHYQWRAAHFVLCSALMAIEQWGIFSLPHLLWHEESVYNGNPRGTVARTPIAERLAVQLSNTVFTTKVYRDWDLNTQLSACGANALRHCTTATVFSSWMLRLFILSLYSFPTNVCSITYLNRTERRLCSSNKIRNLGHKTRENKGDQNRHICIASQRRRVAKNYRGP